MHKIIRAFSVVLFFFGFTLENARAQFRTHWHPAILYTFPDISEASPVIAVNGLPIELKDGLDLSKKIILHTGLPTWNEDQHRFFEFRNINFSGTIFMNVDFRGCEFIDCDFSGTRFDRVLMHAVSKGCNFQDARITNTSPGTFTRQQLFSTANYKNKSLFGVRFEGDYSGISFAGFNLINASICGDLTDCDFTDAIIAGANIHGMSVGRTYMTPSGEPVPRLKIEQLLVTKDFKSSLVKEVIIHAAFPDHAVDLSNIIFIDCTFIGSGKIDLTNSVITGCDFYQFGYRKENYRENTGRMIPYGLGGLTLENVKSTWNYKHGRMAGITLPDEIQKALDAEKENQSNP